MSDCIFFIYTGKQKTKTLKIIKSILKKNPSEKITYGSWKIINKNKKKYYKDKKNLIHLSSKYIHSDGLWENVGLAIKITSIEGSSNPAVKT